MLVALAETEAAAVGTGAALRHYGEALVATSNDELRARLHTDMAAALADAFELRAARDHAALGVDAAQRTGRLSTFRG